MDALATPRNPPPLFRPSGLDHFALRRPNNLLKGFLHVPGHADFIIAPFEVKLQNWDAPLIHDIVVNFAVAVFIGNHFTAPVEVHERAVQFPAALFEFQPVPPAQKAL